MLLGGRLICALAGLSLPLAVAAQEHAHHAPQPDDAAARKQRAWEERLAAAPLAVGAALDAQGRLWLARTENRRLLVSRSDDGGRSFTPPAAVTPEPESIAADGESRPKIAVAADGTVHVSWNQSLGKPMSGHIRYARSTDAGKTFSRPVILNDDRQEISHRFDALAIDGRGRVAAVWLDARGRDAKAVKGSPATGVGLYAAVSEDGGASFGRNRKLAEHTCQCCRTGLIWTAGGPVAFWRHVFGKNIRDFAIADLNGGPVRRVTDDEWEIDGCPHHGGGIAADGRGNLHLTWFTNGKKRQGIFYRRIGAEGMSQPLPLGDPARQAGHPAVAAHGDRVLAAWREFDGKLFSAWAMFSNDAGATWSAAQQLAKSAQASDYVIPLIGERQALLVWNTAAEGLNLLPVKEAAR